MAKDMRKNIDIDPNKINWMGKKDPYKEFTRKHNQDFAGKYNKSSFSFLRTSKKTNEKNSKSIGSAKARTMASETGRPPDAPTVYVELSELMKQAWEWFLRVVLGKDADRPLNPPEVQPKKNANVAEHNWKRWSGVQSSNFRKQKGVRGESARDIMERNRRNRSPDEYGYDSPVAEYVEPTSDSNKRERAQQRGQRGQRGYTSWLDGARSQSSFASGYSATGGLGLLANTVTEKATGYADIPNEAAKRVQRATGRPAGVVSSPSRRVASEAARRLLNSATGASA